MLRFIRQGQRWVVTAVVVAVGAVFVLFFGPWNFSRRGGQGSSTAPISVDGIQYQRDDVARIRENIEKQYRDQLGDQFDAVSGKLQLQDRAVRQLVDRAILADEAHRMGLTASDAEVQRVILRAFDGFRDADGNPDEEQARAYVNYEWGSVRHFKQAVRTDIIVQKLGRVLFASAGVSKAEARDSIRYRDEQVRIAFVALDPDVAPASLPTVPGDVEEFARSAADQIKAYYDENLSKYQLPERIRLRHVLISGTDDAARKRAEAVRARIEAGEDMGSVAREVSDDEGSKELGGDLGLLPVSQVAPVLREAVSGLEDHQLSPVIKGELGFHIVRVEERKPAETRSLDDVRLEIAKELYRKEQATKWATENADALADRIAGGESLEDAARDLKLPIERTALFHRRPDGFIPDLGDSVEVQTAAFALGKTGATWPHPLAAGNKTVFIQLLERKSPDAGEIESEVEAERERLVQQAQARAEQIWLADRRSQLQAEGRIHIDPSALDEGS